MFGYIKAFEKLEVFMRNVDSERFRYFQSLRSQINDLPKDDRTALQKLFLNIIESTVEQFFTRFAKFRELEETAKFMRFPDSVKLEELNLQMSSWIDLVDFEMQLIEFQSSSIWKQKFIDHRVDLENIEKSDTREKCRKRTFEDLECHSRKIFLFKKPCNSTTLYVYIYIGL